MDFLFEPAVAGDFDALADLRIAAMRESLERIGRFDPVRARERLAAGFAPEHTRHIISAGQRVGFVVLKPQADGLLLDHPYLHPDAQGRGIGAAVLRAVLDDADARGLAVQVGALRGSDANRFYLRHGFRRVSESEFDLLYRRPASGAGLGPD